MLNQEMRIVKMTRSDMCRVRQALTGVILAFREEIDSVETTETRRQIAKSSLDMWERIRSDLTSQLEKQDQKYAE